MNKKIITGVLIVVIAVALGYVASILVHPQTVKILGYLGLGSNGTTSDVVVGTTVGATSKTVSKMASNQIMFTPSSLLPVSMPTLFAKGVRDSARIYKVGVVTGGIYDGADVWFVTAPSGEVVQDLGYHFVRLGEKITLILKNSSKPYEGDSLDHSMFAVDEGTEIVGLVFPETISWGKLNFLLDKNTNDSVTLFDHYAKMANLKQAFSVPGVGDVYMNAGASKSGRPNENGFYLKAPDGTLRVYELTISFFDKAHNLPKITWDNGTANQVEYVATDKGGCGSTNYISVIEGVTTSDLVAVGKTVTGDAVYQLRDINHKVLKEIYDSNYFPTYGKEKMSYDSFVSTRPTFFWYDSFGRLIKFLRADFVNPAECGKPVIYLYPTKTTKVSVQIHPQGGLTKSEPIYGTGWNVIATPESKLTEISTGKVYPYLFWEGSGGIYTTPKKGFVVKAEDVHSFLVSKLTAFGLNATEKADFIEFWEPKMSGAPYFFVTFLGNLEMDRIAPLTVSPKPDTIIRVLMDFMPLQKNVVVTGYEIKTPPRNGFTVVEWGGVLR